MATRAEIIKAREDVESAKSKIKESRSQVQSAQEQVSKGRQQLVRKKRVSFTPRKERLARKKFKGQLGAASQELSEAEKQLLAQKSKVQKYETDVLDPADEALTSYEREKAAYEQALGHYNKGMAGAYLYHMKSSDGPEVALVRKYLKELVKQQRAGNIFPTETILGKERIREDAAAKREIMKLRKELDIPFKGWEKTAELIKEKLSGGYKEFDKPLKGYYDPVTGKEIMQSMDPKIAEGLGYIPVDVKGFQKETGKYLIESPTGLLTPSQQAHRQFIEKISPDIKRVETPTMFEVGGERKKNVFGAGGYDFQFRGKALGDFGNRTGTTTRAVLLKDGRIQDFTFRFKEGKLVGANPLGSPQKSKTTKKPFVSIESKTQLPSFLTGGQSSSFELAALAPAYSGKKAQAIEFERDPEAFVKKYGYSVDPKGDIAAMAGGASGIINIGPPREKGESFMKWYVRNIKSKDSVASAAALASLGAGGAASFSTKAALALNAKNVANLLDPAETNKTKVASLKEIGLSLGTGFLGGAAFGAAAKLSKDAITATGLKILSTVLKGGGSKASIIARNVAGLSLVGAGKLTNTAVNTYFKTALLGEAIGVAEAARSRDFYEASLGVSGFAGMLAGFPVGEKVGGKVFDIGLSYAGRYVPTRLEKFTKRAPSSIQAEILTGKDPIFGYRRGPIKTGLEFEPRIDLWLSGKVKQPTKTTFFRFEETRGVKGGEILPSLSMPSFVQPPRYKEMFLSNFKNKRKSLLKNIIDTLAETPVLADVLAVGRFQTKKIPQMLRNKAIQEYATTGKLTKATQKELLKYDTLISDKIRELEFQDEQEAVFRSMFKLKNTKSGFTRGPDGNLIPVIYEAGTLKPRLNKLLDKKIILEQDAKFIQRQYNMWKKFGDDYILPKKHSVAHSKAVMKNVRKIIMAYPEYHSYLIKKYGSVERAISEIQKGARIHDLGKTSETSQEFGTPHGKKVSDVYKAGLLPKEVANIKPEVAKAIETHETIAGTPRGRYTLKYKVYDFFGRYSYEQKILATADRLDLMRYGIKVDPKRLPLGDAMEKLKLKVPVSLKRKEAPREVGYRPQNYLIPLYAPAPTKVPAYREPAYEPQSYILPEYKEPYKRAPSYKEPKHKRPLPYREPAYKKPPSYKKPRYKPQSYLMPEYKKPYRKAPPYKKPPVRPPTQFETLIIRPKAKRPVKPVKKKKRKKGFKTLPTLTQQIIGYKGKRAIARPTGFEAIRII